ncbi:hypothetical protein, partial [Psychrobacter sp.]|uniref:hypothetical protein n=1 Tax=Psychrobacter sp. TaxID=56811 RepID=UPI002653789A|nr:hypothetical protein [Psychrobacter sp.]
LAVTLLYFFSILSDTPPKDLGFDNNTLTTIAKTVKKYQICTINIFISKHIAITQNTPCVLSTRLV